MIQNNNIRMYDFFAHHVLLEGDCQLGSIKVGEELGRGNSHVYTVEIQGEVLALKQIQIKTDYEHHKFLKEITFMKELSQSSSFMIKYRGYFLTKVELNQYVKHKYAFILMEHALMNLQQYQNLLRDRAERMQVFQLQDCIQSLLQAFYGLEKMNVAHCDIKPENILITNLDPLELRLCDVGSCKIVSEESLEGLTILGTVPFLAPELVKTKNSHIVSQNPFKSDVFSLGLVTLYLITFKKFKSHDRLQVQESTYEEILSEWIKEASQIIDERGTIYQFLTSTLQFNQYKRPHFKILYDAYEARRHKQEASLAKQLNYLEKGEKQDLINYCSTSNDSVLMKSLLVQKNSFVKTTLNGNAFRIARIKNYSPLPKRKGSPLSDSPEKQILSSMLSCSQIKRVIYINQGNRAKIPYEQIAEGGKIFILSVADVQFDNAETVTILSSCTFDVFYMLERVDANRLYVQFQGITAQGLPCQEGPKLTIPKIRANLCRSSLSMGYGGVFRMFAHQNLELLQLWLSESQVVFSDVIQLLDILETQCKLHTLLISYEGAIISPDEHTLLTRKVSRLPLKKLTLLMSENFIKYDKETHWALPSNCETLYLDYSHNLLSSAITNFSISLSELGLRELYLSFENNNLGRGQVNMLIKNISSIGSLEKLTLNLSMNKIQDTKYLTTHLLQFTNLHVCELKLHKTEIPLVQLLDTISSLKALFDFSLRILKITYDRCMRLNAFASRINEVISFAEGKNTKNIHSNIVGYDNLYFMLYLKKQNRMRSVKQVDLLDQRSLYNKSNCSHFQQGNNNSKDKTNNLINQLPAFSKNKTNRPFPKLKQNFSRAPGPTIGPQNTQSSFMHKKSSNLQLTTKDRIDTNITLRQSSLNNLTKSSNVCIRLFSLTQTYQNYRCLKCCGQRETMKFAVYCKFCIEHCQHKGHSIVKIYERGLCCCSHSNECKSQVNQLVCAETMKIPRKRMFACLKCNSKYCLACAKKCRLSHPQWVKMSENLMYFCCGKDTK